ncbi:MAG: IclR family transcriptional regulator [Actinomycetota bacterium]
MDTFVQPEMGVSAIARQSGLPKSTVHRLCCELVDLGFLERRGTGFQLGVYLFEIGQRVTTARVLRDVALPFMEDLFVATGETIHLAVLQGTELLYLEKIVGHTPVVTPSKVGGRLPLYCTALGKAILAFSPPRLLDEVIAGGLLPRTPYTIVTADRLRSEIYAVRRAGVAIEREESRLGVVCAAAPLIGEESNLSGALSISAAHHDKDPERLAPIIRTTALSASRALQRAQSEPR